MGIAKDFNKVLHDQIHVHAAWLPVTNTFQVGDFGVISEGLFVPMGNIRRDFGVAFQTREGNGTKLDFKSDRVRVIRFVAGAEVSVFPGDNVDASLKIEFEKDRSFYLKAALTVSEMESVFQAGRELASKPGWDSGKFKVIAAAYTGNQCAILSSQQSKASVEISGKSGALKRLEIGAAEAGLSFSTRSGLGLEILGATGVVGLRLFKVERDGGPRFEGVRGATSGGPKVTTSEDWPADLADDI
jgi:hypothetical protein